MTDYQKKDEISTSGNEVSRARDLDRMRMVRKRRSAKKSSGKMLAVDLIYRGSRRAGEG